jgi:hypothetical protein
VVVAVESCCGCSVEGMVVDVDINLVTGIRFEVVIAVKL